MARYREAAAGAGFEVGGEMREAEELPGDKKKILEKLMDQDEEEPEVGEIMFIIVTFVFLQSVMFIQKCPPLFIVVNCVFQH